MIDKTVESNKISTVFNFAGYRTIQNFIPFLYENLLGSLSFPAYQSFFSCPLAVNEVTVKSHHRLDVHQKHQKVYLPTSD